MYSFVFHRVAVLLLLRGKRYFSLSLSEHILRYSFMHMRVFHLENRQFRDSFRIQIELQSA